MPQNPHEYTLRKNWHQPEDWEAVVQFIRDHGYRIKFGKVWYKVLDINGMRYWTMGAPLKITILINRAKLETSDSPYDTIAPLYDGMWSSPEATAEDAEVIKRVGYQGGALLDVGCGTGLLLDHLKPSVYVGIDPSLAMLDLLRAKHGKLPTTLLTPLERYCAADQRFDLIVSLYGTPSYIHPDALRRLPAMLAPGGRYFLMFYNEGYVPVTHLRADKPVPFYQHPRDALPGTVYDFGHYFVVEGEASWSKATASIGSSAETSALA